MSTAEKKILTGHAGHARRLLLTYMVCTVLAHARLRTDAHLHTQRTMP